MRLRCGKVLVNRKKTPAENVPHFEVFDCKFKGKSAAGAKLRKIKAIFS